MTQEEYEKLLRAAISVKPRTVLIRERDQMFGRHAMINSMTPSERERWHDYLRSVAGWPPAPDRREAMKKECGTCRFARRANWSPFDKTVTPFSIVCNYQPPETVRMALALGHLIPAPVKSDHTCSAWDGVETP